MRIGKTPAGMVAPAWARRSHRIAGPRLKASESLNAAVIPHETKTTTVIALGGGWVHDERSDVRTAGPKKELSPTSLALSLV
jgi:hypothetical protein